MVRSRLLVGMLLIVATAEGAVPPPQPCCYVWSVGSRSAVIRKDGVLLRFRAEPSLIRTFRVDEFFFNIPDFAPGSKVTLQRLGSKGPRGWVWRTSEVKVVLEDFLPPEPSCCRVEFIDRDIASLTVRKLEGDGGYEAVATKWRSYALPPVARGAPASVDRDGRYLFVRVANPDRTYVLEILPRLHEPGDLGAGAYETIAPVRASQSMAVRGADRFEPVVRDPEGAKRLALRRLQIEALDKRADAVIATSCRKDELAPMYMLCEGEAIRIRKGKR
jgi:hypothetical protein